MEREPKRRREYARRSGGPLNFGINPLAPPPVGPPSHPPAPIYIEDSDEEFQRTRQYLTVAYTIEEFLPNGWRRYHRYNRFNQRISAYDEYVGPVAVPLRRHGLYDR